MNLNTQSLKDSLKEKITNAIKDNLKMEEKEFHNRWASQDKASVMQSARCFSETPIDFEKCVGLLTNVMYLLQQGEKFTQDEMTRLFFDVTKLFQCPNTRLRRMVYLIAKELEPSESEVFMMMSCLIKDMNSKDDCFRANSVRVISRILDPAMAAQIDRYLKTAIVDKNPFVASSALIAGINLSRTVPDVVKRWVNEVQTTVQSQHQMVQFHALALMYELKKTDRLALHKVVTQLAKSQLKSPMAECLLIRYAAQILMTERDPSVEKILMAYLDNCLRHKNEMVTYEAARSLCHLAVCDKSGESNTVFGYDITHATTVLQIFLTSLKPVIRFGAIRTLNLLAQHRPQMAARCNTDMEPLLSDQNRSTATLALTTLLKTGHESSVERLVKQITTFMSDISDSYKLEVVRAVKGLCLQYPGKYKVLMSFLSSNLREDGSNDFKTDIVDALILIIGQVPAAREVGLTHLCEFIEDCEYASLCVRILGFLAEEVPKTSLPSKYIRFIYNRLILENASVRAAAVDTLTKIAIKCDALKQDILILLQFGQNDNDDEVRERISLYSTVLEQCLDESKPDAKVGCQALMSVEMPFSIDALYDGLLDHLNSEVKHLPFNLNDLPTEESYKATAKAQAALTEKKKPVIAGMPAPKTAADEAKAVAEAKEAKAAANAELMKLLSEIGTDVGPLQHSCKPKYLTETEAEYTVQVIKHMFKQHLVLEMYVSNTLQGTCLENVEVKLTGLQPNWTDVGGSSIDRLDHGQQASAYVVLQRNGEDEDNLVTGSLGAALHFLMKEEDDPVGFEDDYPVENINISVGDYMSAKGLAQGQFKSVWEEFSKAAEATEKLSLNFKSLETAVEAIIALLNMEPCDKTGRVESGVRGHTLLMSGVFLGGNTVLVKALVGMDPNHGCLCKISCRSRSQNVCNVLAKALL
mmetsp:Transcript_121639/g.214467  ORF Transcript_121639/g.214467 Transcript_121639/m.214467 type:complete len:925 (-) Transcript_121639:145-2919(-)